MVLQQNLVELVEDAATIVKGHVVSARVEPHPQLDNLQTVVVTLRVEDTLKGQAGETFTFRQFIWDVREGQAAAGYKKGQHLLILLTQPSRYGLSSPVGLGQGRFHLRRTPEGKELALNEYANAALFRGVDKQLARRGIRLPPGLQQMVQDHRSGPLPMERLEKLIRELAGSR